MKRDKKKHLTLERSGMDITGDEGALSSITKVIPCEKMKGNNKLLLCDANDNRVQSTKVCVLLGSRKHTCKTLTFLSMEDRTESIK